MSGHTLVVGANGTVGRPLVAALLARGASVRAASRSGRSVAGSHGVVLDLADPATFGPALADVDRAYVMMPTGNLAITEQLVPLIAAAAERKVKVVFQSVFGVDADDSIPYRQVEIALETSGTPFVILRPNWFADNFLTFWKPGIDQGVIALPAGAGRSSFIDARDIAASAVAALCTHRFDGGAFNLTGPEALGYGDAAAILSAVLGRPVSYQATDEDAFIAMLTGAGVPAAYAGFLAGIFLPVRAGWTAAVTDDVQRLTGRAPRSLALWAEDHAAELKA